MTTGWEKQVRETLKKDRDIVQLNLQDVENFFRSRGFSVVELRQPWRHVVGTLEKEGQRFFLKLGSTADLSMMRTRRETVWLEFVRTHMTGNEPFMLPRIYEKGWYQQDLFWFISDWFEENRLAIKKPPDSKNLSAWLGRIAEAARFLVNIKPPDERSATYLAMYPETKDDPVPSTGTRLLSAANVWHGEIKQDLDDLMKIMEDQKDSLKPSVQHADFVPWHMFEIDKRRFTLIDADLGSFRAPRYYDAAGFYHSVWVRLGEKYSRKFLHLFLKIHGKPWKAVSEEFRPILAQRITGGFWDKKNEGDSNLQPNFAILDAFRRDKLL